MIILHVFLHSKPDLIDALKEVNIKNANSSIKEQGVLRFDVLQQDDDSSRFLLVEVYKDEKAIVQHKETDHYAQWVKNAEPMLAEPRTKIIYKNVSKMIKTAN
ncbi:MAG: antibiotic biosynthesis monooxygenase [Actinobacteria bacterium]|nr:antibiotic biosynthesis monooxygenase [Actinomycetota bacterium]